MSFPGPPARSSGATNQICNIAAILRGVRRPWQKGCMVRRLTWRVVAGPLTIVARMEYHQKSRARSAVVSGAVKVAMSPSITSKPVKSLRTQGA